MREENGEKNMTVGNMTVGNMKIIYIQRVY